MRNHKNIIKINGKQYDARTGSIINGSIVEPQNKPKPSIDGFIIAPQPQQNNKPHSAPHSAHKKQPNTPHPHQQNHKKQPASSRQAGNHTKHRKPQRTNTLARNVVKKPSATRKHHAPRHPKPIKKRGYSISQDRLQRAQSVAKSPTITRFERHQTSSITKKHTMVEVRPEPAQHNYRTVDQTRDQNTKPTTPTNSHTSSHKQHQPSIPKSAAEKQFTKAMNDALSHQEKVNKKSTPRSSRLADKLGVNKRTLNAMAGVLSVVLLVGFFAYQNIPNLSLQMASNRAGISAQMPGYTPSGFSFGGPIEYGPGKVSVPFQSNSDDRYFTLTQQSSNWNSEALLDNYIVENNKQYETFNEKGKTIYVYDGSNATWVSGGVLYKIEGTSDLNKDQLIRMATSL